MKDSPKDVQPRDKAHICLPSELGLQAEGHISGNCKLGQESMAQVQISNGSRREHVQALPPQVWSEDLHRGIPWDL